MNTRLAGLLTSGMLLLTFGLRSADDAKWVSLFTGKDLAGWTGVHDVTFEVNDGNLRLVKGMGWLRTEKQYGDFVLEVECRPLVEKYDSGIFLRAGLEGKPWPKDGWQVNLRYDAMGALVKGYQVVEPTGFPRLPVNQWIKLHLEVRGSKAVLEVNGERAWEYEKIDATRGYIGIQAEERAFDFRNFRIREL